MKLICLNLWGGRRHVPLMKYLNTQKNADIFCFQEVLTNSQGAEKYRKYRANLLAELGRVLKNHKQIFSPSFTCHDIDDGKKIPLDLAFGQAMFVRRGIKILSHGAETVHKGKKAVKNPLDDFRCVVQFARLENNGEVFSLFNFHGVATWPKTDTPARIRQSDALVKTMRKFKTPRILCGDFNLAPETRSLSMLEAGMTELVKKYKIESTRPVMKQITYPYSDYMLTSKEIKVLDFKVPKIAVSDHLPLVLDFELEN